MTPFGPQLILSAFLLFCRIGACLMLMPGFSSSRVPVNVRLFIAISCTLALTPLLAPQLHGVGSGASPIGIAQIIIGETLIGALIGFMARLFFLALETLAMAAAMAIGLAANLGAPIDRIRASTAARLTDLAHGDHPFLRERSALGGVAGAFGFLCCAAGGARLRYPVRTSCKSATA